MQFDPENKVVKLCADGMMAEGEGKPEVAKSLFQEAWDNAENDFQAFIAAHYLARHQSNIQDKLKWDLEALNRAKNVAGHETKHAYPSLNLNIGKCYEDMGDRELALKYYRTGQDHAAFLPEDGYSNMIRAGLENGLKRVGAE